MGVVVVGAGAAGLSTAYALAARGVETLILEFGPLPEPRREFLTDLWPDELPLRGLGATGREYYCSAHFTNERNAPYRMEPEVNNSWLKRARVVGGKTLYWSAHALRFSDYEFKSRTLQGWGEDWPICYSDLARYYTQAEQLMGVCGSVERLKAQPDGQFLPPFAFRRGEQILQRLCPVPFIHARKAIMTVMGERPRCHECGRCWLGCPTSAKFDAYTGIYQRLAGRVRLQYNTVVQQLVAGDDGRVQSVVCVDRVTKQVKEVAARAVVLAASPIETARLLLNSRARSREGLANSSGLVGNYLSESVGVRVEGLLPQLKGVEVVVEDGSGEHGLIPRFVNLGRRDRPYGAGFLYLVQSGAELFPSFASRISGYGEALKREIRQWYPAGVRFYGIGQTVSELHNRVVIDSKTLDEWGSPVAKCEYSLNTEDYLLCRDMGEWARSLLEKAQAEYIQIYDPETGGGLHACGTCRMGTDPKRSVVNPYGQAHDYSNLFIVDASTFVSSLNQPTLTVMALALRAGEFIADWLK